MTLVLLALAGIGPVRAAVDDLVKNSPFLPPDTAASSAAAGASDVLELRSIVGDGSDCQFSIYDLVKQKAAWVGLNEKGHDFVVTGFDSENDAVTVDYLGRVLNLELQKEKIHPLPANSALPANAVLPPNGLPRPVRRRLQLPGQVGVQPQLQPGALGSIPPAGDAATRIESIQQEVQRRRAWRQQQGGQPNGPAALPPAAALPMPGAMP
jgi:hypothetical protein